MKRKVTLLIVPLVVLLAVGLIVAGCGSSTTTTTVTSASTTTSAAGSTTTAAGGAGGIPTMITVPLTGAQEVPPTNTGATGTFTLTLTMPSGASASTASTSAGGGLIPPGLTVSFKLEVTNMTNITAAHIHLGAMGQNGPVIYPLFTGPVKNGSFTGVLAEGPLVESNLTGPYQGKTFADLVTAVLTGQTYVNVHTTANPNGEIRGQIVISTGGATPTTAAGGPTTTAAAGGTATTTSGY